MNTRTNSAHAAFAALILLCAPVAARATSIQSPPASTDKDKSTDKDNQRALLDQAFHSLEEELKAAIEEYSVQRQAASKQGLPQDQWPPSPTPGFYDRFEQLALQDQPDALRWCIGIAGSIGFSMDEAIARKLVLYEHMVKAHAASHWIDDIIQFLRNEGGPTGVGVERGTGFLADIAKATSNAQTRANALWTEGSLFFDSKKPEEQARATAVWKEIVAKCPNTPQSRRAAGLVFQADHLQVGMTAPDVSTVDTDGAAFKLSDFRGKVTVVVFWGFWSKESRALIGTEQALVERFKDKPFAIVGVNTDMSKDDYKRVADQAKLTWKNSWQGNRQGPWPEAWGIIAFPSVFVLDQKGVVRALDVRGDTLTNQDALSGLITKILAEPQTKTGGDSPAPK